MMHDIQVIVMGCGLALVLVAGESGPSRYRDVALIAGLVLVAIGAIGMQLRGKLTRSVPRDAGSGSSDRLLLQLGVRTSIAVAILVIALAAIDWTLGVLVFAVSLGATVLVAIWHQSRSVKLEVPRSEQWRLQHRRVLDLPVPLARALEATEETMRTDLQMRIDRPTTFDVFGEQNGNGGRTRIAATGIATSPETSEIRLTSRPRAAVLDGGKSWGVLVALERRVRERCAD
jgi:hypothetical protein